jgi:hypothetical protein
MYAEGSQRSICSWSPQFWLIPTDTELNELDRLLPQANDDDDDDDFRGPVTEFRKDYFSATAIAIRFLQQLDPQVRMHVRSIVIEEEHASGESQASHAQGLIPFCQENPKLRVETRVDLWRTIILHSGAFNTQGPNTRGILLKISHWISEIICLRDLGMPKDQFSLVFQGGTAQLSQQMCDVVKRAAAVQDALEWHHSTQPADARYHPLLINKISEAFPSDVRQVIQGNTPIRFDAHTGELWDVREVIQAQEQLGPFPDWWEEVCPSSSFDQPPQGWEDMWNEYIVKVDSLRKMNR